MKYLVSGVEEDRFEPKLLRNALFSFIEIMEHEYLQWDSVQQYFIKKVLLIFKLLFIFYLISFL